MLHGAPGWWEAIQIVLVSVGSLSGIPQLWEALHGVRLVSNRPLAEMERWQLGMGGLVQIVLHGLLVLMRLHSNT